MWHPREGKDILLARMDEEPRPAPRIYCIPAASAPVVAVFRRGPTNWSHVGRWDLEKRRYDPGAWIRGRLFPRRSDLSPNGRWLCYFAHKPAATWGFGEAYVAVSRLPWLTALHAVPTCGTWTRGYHFTEDAGFADADRLRLPIPYGLRSTSVVQFAIERVHGWEEAADSPQRDPADAWDVKRNARVQKRQPGGDRLLRVESVGMAGGEFGVEQAVDGMRLRYGLESGGDLEPLDALQWADWDAEGHMLAATRDGRIQIRRFDGDGIETLFEVDLTRFEPHPVAAPAWAESW